MDDTTRNNVNVFPENDVTPYDVGVSHCESKIP